MTDTQFTARQIIRNAAQKALTHLDLKEHDPATIARQLQQSAGLALAELQADQPQAKEHAHN